MTGKQIAAGAAAVIIAAGAYGYYSAQDGQIGPGSGEEITGDEPTGPGSGEELGPGETNEPTGPGSGEELGPGETNEPTGPGSGEELGMIDEPTGPGSGEELGPGETNEPTGPGSGEELPDIEPTGPGSGEELPPVDPNAPTGPGSGEELPDIEPTGPGSGEEAEPSPAYLLMEEASGSCNVIGEASTCVEYIGSFWDGGDGELNCGRPDAYSDQPCPRPVAGGCNTSADESIELVIWHYDYGGDPFTAEVVPFASMACEATGGIWIGG